MFNENVICAYTYISMAVSVPLPSPSACLQVHSLVEWASSWHTALRMEPSTGLLFLSGCFRQASCLLANSPWKSWERQREGGKKEKLPSEGPCAAIAQKIGNDRTSRSSMRKIDHFLSTSPRRLRWLMSLLHLRRVAPPNTPLGSRKNAKGFFTVRAMAGAHAKGCDKLTKAPSTSQTVEAREETFEVFFSLLFVWGSPSFQERDRTITSSPVHQTPMPSMLNKTWTKLGGLGCRKCEGRRINKK